MAKKTTDDNWDLTPNKDRGNRRTITQILDKNKKKSASDDSDSSSSSSSSKKNSSKKKSKTKVNTSKTYTNVDLIVPSRRYVAPDEYSVSRAGLDLYETDEKHYVPFVPTGSVSGVGTTTVEDDTIDSSNEEDAKGFSLHLGTIYGTHHVGGISSFNFESSYKDMDDNATVNLDKVNLNHSYKGVCTRLLADWNPPDTNFDWEHFYIDPATYGFVTEQTFTENNVEIKINGFTKTLDMKYKFDFKQMYRSEIINQVIKTAGLIPVLNFKGLHDDITDFKNYSESDSSSESTNIKSTGSNVLDEVVKKAIGTLTETLAKAKAIDKAFKNHVYYKYYRDVHHPDIEDAWNNAHLNCADGANVLCAMFLSIGINATIVHTAGKDGKGHYIVKLDISGQTYYTDNAASTGSHTTRSFGSVWGPTSGSVVGTKIPS